MKTLHRLPALLIFACLLTPAAAAELAPSWTLVPDSTVLIARADLSKFLKALRRQTKFGAIVLSEERVSRGIELWKSENQTEWEATVKELGEVGLKPEDLAQLFAGECGFALTLEPRGERAPLLVGLTWLEPGEELAQRTIKAIQDALEKHADAPHPTQRVDLDLAGAQVMHLTIPIMHAENLDPNDFAPDDEGDESQTPEALKKRREALMEKLKNRKTIEADRGHLFIARLGGRLLVANTFPQSSTEVLAKDEEERSKIDWDKQTGAEEATGVFARFLEAHAGQGSGHAAELLNTPGIAAALPEGVPLLEIIGDPRPLLKLLVSQQEKIGDTLKALGLDAVGPLAIRTVLDGTVLRGGVFISAPEPRAGVLTLLDQTPLTPAPPPWVPSSALEFQQFSFDLGAAFAKIKELMISMGGDRARQGFVQMETPVQNFLQTDLATLLSSLGHQHSVVSFTPKTDAAPAVAADEPTPAAIAQRTGVVWQVKDEPLWQRVMQTIGQFAPAAGGAVQAAEEQGFNGYRVQQGPAQMGLFLGRGYLVLGIGDEVTESLLSVLRNPPEGNASMAASGLVERAAALLPPAPCLIYQLSDAGLSVKTTKRAIEQMIELPLAQRARLAQLPGANVPAGDTAAATAFAAKLKELLPSDEELEGVLGVSVGQTTVNEHGLSSQSAVELPAP